MRRLTLCLRRNHRRSDDPGQVNIDLEGSYGELDWSNMGGGCSIYGFGCGVAHAINGPLSATRAAGIVGADFGWNPVTNLNFDLELMVQATNQDKPSGFLRTVYNFGDPGAAYFAPGDWRGDSIGLAGRLRITRYF